MTIGFLFWLIMILLILFSLFSNWNGWGRFGPLCNSAIIFVLLFLLGWKVFGWPIRG